MASVPKYIREKMHRYARLQKQSSDLLREIEEWLENQGLDPGYDGPGGLRCSNGMSLCELDDGIDITDELCDIIDGML